MPPPPSVAAAAPAPPAEHRALALLPLVALAAAVAPLLARGYPLGHDWVIELARVAQHREAILGGQLPPAWTDDLYRGFGSPLFLFYAPLWSGAAALLGVASGGVASGAALAIAASLAVAALSMRHLARVALAGAPDPAAARVACALYVLHPYLLGDALLRNASGELLGLALAPLPLAAALRLSREPARAALALALALGLAVPAHNLTALTTLALAVALAAAAHGGRGLGKAALPLALGVALGLALSAWFWAPALILKGEVQTDRLVTGKFDFHRNFPPLDDILFGKEFYAAGALSAVALAAGLVAGARRAAAALLGRGAEGHAAAGAVARGRLLAALLGAAAVLLLLMTPASVPLWETVPLLPLFQFPWRLVGPLALVASLLAALAFADLARGLAPGRRAALEVVILAAALLCAARPLVTTRWMSRDEAPRIAALLEPAAIRASGLTATVVGEYLPRGADERLALEPRAEAGPVLSVSPTASAVTVLVDRGTRIVARIERPTGVPEDVRIRFARWHFRGWETRVDDAPFTPATAGPGGVVLALVPAAAGPGPVLVEARYRAPPLARASCAVSALAAAAWVALRIAVGRRAPVPAGGAA